jgi:hypothetical protein
VLRELSEFVTIILKFKLKLLPYLKKEFAKLFYKICIVTKKVIFDKLIFKNVLLHFA